MMQPATNSPQPMPPLLHHRCPNSWKTWLTAMVCAVASASAFAQPSGSAAKQRPAGAAAPATGYGDHAQAMRYAEEIAARHALDPQWTRLHIGQAQRQAQAIRFMTPAPKGTAKNWTAYRARFIEPTRVRAGRAFWLDHEADLQKAQDTFGVPASVIVGIIGVETLYGRHTGQFRVIDALTTLAFDFPDSHPRAMARTQFFREELEQFLLLSRRHGWSPQDPRGSFAGAMGWPQFMPSSWSRFAIDFDGDGQTDLFNSVPDVIGSVANYLREFGWQPGMPTHYPVTLQASVEQMNTLLAPDILPTFTAQSFHAQGALLGPQALMHAGKLALVELENGGAPRQYVAGTENFYAITRYNWSSYYAMAVIELGEAVQASMAQR